MIVNYIPLYIKLCWDQVVIDVRNNYETRIGKFKGAVDPCTTSFREFPSWVDSRLSKFNFGQSNSEEKEYSIKERYVRHSRTPPRVAMYCTGGIRCEKASSFLLSKGFKEVLFLFVIYASL